MTFSRSFRSLTARTALTTIATTALSITAALAIPLAAQAHDRSHRDDDDELRFKLVRTPGLAAFPGCLPNVQGRVSIEPGRGVEEMRVKVWGLPPNTNFDFFVIQVPNPPFGMSWYQGDIETDRKGRGYQRFIGRFNVETFTVAPNIAPAPEVHHEAIPDAGQNPSTGPIHQYHLGLWFNSPNDAIKAGCPGVVTAFNGEHNAGIQVLNTSNFPDLKGPLIQLAP